MRDGCSIRPICVLVIPQYMVKRYTNFSLPSDLADRVGRLITKRKDLGYTSVSEFAKDSIRRLLDVYEKGK